MRFARKHWSASTRNTNCKSSLRQLMNKFLFFTGLVHLPHLYASFQDSQYKHVFAICLPYTDPFRYAQSIVCTLFRPLVVSSLEVRQESRDDFFLQNGANL